MSWRAEVHQLHYDHETGDVDDTTFAALVAECERLGIRPYMDLMVTDNAGSPMGPALRYRCWVRKNGWGIRNGRPAATRQAAAESLLAKLRGIRA